MKLTTKTKNSSEAKNPQISLELLELSCLDKIVGGSPTNIYSDRNRLNFDSSYSSFQSRDTPKRSEYIIFI